MAGHDVFAATPGWRAVVPPRDGQTEPQVRHVVGWYVASGQTVWPVVAFERGATVLEPWAVSRLLAPAEDLTERMLDEAASPADPR